AQRERLAFDEALIPAASGLADALDEVSAALADHAAGLQAELEVDRAGGEEVAAELRRCSAEEARLQGDLRARGERVTTVEVTAQQVRDHAAEAESELGDLAGRLELAPEPAEEAEPERPEDEDEQLGVEIEMTPAGKSMKRLSLLSGGEKSLTALAFLFAIFLARPCPFYVLDEVEAALDDLNIDRFLTLLRRYSGAAQFIVVTHQKRTMEAADTLYGVSMGDDGISEVISRRLPRESSAAAADAAHGEAGSHAA